ncbi:MAG: tyrosine-type recombinase/integrase [Chloroflexota bacterium]|nr:tyrosine-type recombinase/integrase [Chloroflexota bacterium]
MSAVRWDRYPLVAAMPLGRTWLKIQGDLGLSPNTVEAYARGLEDYLRSLATSNINPLIATRAHIALYVGELRSRPGPRGDNARRLDSGAGLANATLQQRLTAVRLFYDFLVEEGVRADNPVGRGRYTPGRCYGGQRARGLVPRHRKLPWIPTDEEWRAILQAASGEPLRNRVMLALQYDAALRREELCSLRSGDVDPAHRLVTVRAETTKNRQERVVPYSEATGELFGAYLRERRRICALGPGPLFVSESRRNRGQPISIWTWSKVIEGIARRSGVHRFSTHTPRHLCLTDLARAGWDIHEIARFAGHRSTDSTLAYIHLSGRDLAEKLGRTMAQVHAWGAQAAMEPSE